MNAHVAAIPGGRLAWLSDPIDGNGHDSHRLAEAAVPTGNNMITPLKKPPYRDLLSWEKELNTQANKIRWVIERVIAHLKAWRTLDTDCRRPTGTFPETIPAVIAPPLLAPRVNKAYSKFFHLTLTSPQINRLLNAGGLH